MSLHREVVAPRRSTWLRIFISVALGAAATAAIFEHRTTVIDRERRVAEQRTADARRAAAQAAARLDALHAELDALARRAADPPTRFPPEPDRSRAYERLAQLRRERDEIMRRLAAARAATRHPPPLHISQDCLVNAVCRE